MTLAAVGSLFVLVSFELAEGSVGIGNCAILFAAVLLCLTADKGDMAANSAPVRFSYYLFFLPERSF